MNEGKRVIEIDQIKETLYLAPNCEIRQEFRHNGTAYNYLAAAECENGLILVIFEPPTQES